MTKEFIEMNDRLIRELNPSATYERFVINNSPNGTIHIAGAKEFPQPKLPDYLHKFSYGRAGYELGTAFNSILKEVKTRFVLFLDPDFFIIYPNWIQELTEYAKKNNIGFLGSPYHPKYWVKKRRFPTNYCLLVDREVIGDEFYSWNWMPEHSESEMVKMQESDGKKKIEKVKRASSESSAVKNFFRKIIDNVKKRRYIATSKECNADLYRRYFRGTVKYESFIPTVTVRDFIQHYHLSRRYDRALYLLERLIPEKYSFVPRKGFTFRSFRDVGSPDVLSTGMEEWWFFRKPFAFHLRGFKQHNGGAVDEEKTKNSILQTIASFAANSR